MHISEVLKVHISGLGDAKLLHGAFKCGKMSYFGQKVEGIHPDPLSLLSNRLNKALSDCNLHFLFVSVTGIAVDRNGLIYFVDGTMIRKVDRNGIISTVLGSNDLTSARPLTCDTSMHIRQVTCFTPSVLTVLYFSPGF